MDTPACPRPRNSREQQIHDRLVLLRDKLLLLKRDNTTHMKSQDVLDLYCELVEQVRELSEARALQEATEETQLDRVLESCFQLISLAFMTTGRNNEAPAAFAVTSTTRRLIDHLMERKGMCSMTDLERISEALDRLEEIVREKAKCVEEGGVCQKSPHVASMLQARIDKQQADVRTLREELAIFQGELADVHEKLIGILRKLAAENTRSRFSTKHVAKLREEIEEIDSRKVDGKFVTADGSVPEGNDDICQLLEYTKQWASLVWENKGEIPETFKPTYDALLRIRDRLEKLSLTQTWSMRETDLFDYQRQLDRLDEAQKNQRWVDEDGNPAPDYVQWTFISMIRKSYALIFMLMMSSEPVSEALIPILSQIQTLKSCLVEVKDAGGVESIRELYPYMMKLDSLKKMRNKDGKFAVGGDIPHGQLALDQKLLECEKLTDELRREV